MKRAKKILLIVVCSILVLLSPYTAFATKLDDAKNINRYNSLALLNMWLQAADFCMGHVHTLGDSILDHVSLSYDTNTSTREKLLNALSGTFTYGDDVVYSNYLESVSANTGANNLFGEWFGAGQDDGKAYCSELGDILKEVFNLSGFSNFEQLACDSDLLKIYIGYGTVYGGSWSGPANAQVKLHHGDEYSWPPGWTEPSEESSLLDSATCHANYNKMVSALGSSVTYEPKKENESFQIVIWVNKSFSPSQYLKEGFTGDLSTVSNQIIRAIKLRHFNQFCEKTEISEANYVLGASNHYKIYDDSGASGVVKYYEMTNSAADEKLYATGDVTSSAQVSCKDIAATLAPDSSSSLSLIDRDRSQEIGNCLNTAQENIERLKEIRAQTNYYYRTVKIILDRAIEYREKGYTGYNMLDEYDGLAGMDESLYYFDQYFSYDYISEAKKYAEKAGGGRAFDAFTAVAEEYLTKLRDYQRKSNDVGLDDQDKENYGGELDNYTKNLDKFKTEIVDELDKQYQNAVDYLNNVPIDDFWDNSGHVKNIVDGFYKFDENNKLTCLANDRINEYRNKIEGITGGDITGFSDYTPVSRVEPTEGGNSDAATAGDPCYNAGIEGMSWILCPALNNMVTTTDAISSILNGWLSIDSNFYNDSSTAHKAWGYFRDIANAVVIVILLIIIVSQLTGYGIDNYGIKKMLPKLVVMVVLINMSFLVCQIAVDLSNILGSGLSNMFKSIGLEIYDGAGVEGFIGGLMTGIFAALGVAGAVGGIAITFVTLASSGSTVMIVIFAVLLLVVALIAVIMFFLALGARLIVVIVFTAISPLAFACYILPNTQSLFKKWWNIFKTALIVYPICGALYGMSFIIKAIIFQDGNGVHLWLAMIGIIAPFLPFMILPSLTKGALAGLGALGGTLTALGNGVKRGVSKSQTALQNSEAYKGQMEAGRRNLNARLAGLRVNSKTGELMKNADGSFQTRKVGRFGKFLAGGDAGMARRRMKVQADQKEIWQEGRYRNGEDGSLPSAFAAGMVAQSKGAEAVEVSNWETLVKSQTQDGANEGELYKLFSDYMKSGNKYGARAVARIAGRRKDTASRFMQEFTKSDFSTKAARGAATAVAKEIAEGVNSRNFLSSAPLRFDFASQINKMGEGANFQYDGDGGWVSTGTIDGAMKNYVTNSSELVGASGSSLREMFAQMDREHGGQMSDETVARIQNLAADTIANRDKGPWDSTKAKELCDLSGGAFEYREEKDERGVVKEIKIIDHRGEAGGVDSTGDTPTSPIERPREGAVREGEILSVRESSEPAPATPAPATGSAVSGEIDLGGGKKILLSGDPKAVEAEARGSEFGKKIQRNEERDQNLGKMGIILK